MIQKLNNPDSEPDYKHLIKEARTLGEMLNVGKEYRLRGALSGSNLSPEAIEDFIHFSNRMYRPWPVWVLRIATEVFSVHLPTIKKQTIFESLRAIHWFLLECEIHNTTQKMPEFNFPPDIKGDLFRVIGHIQKFAVSVDNLFSEVQKLDLPPERMAELNRLKLEADRGADDFSNLLYGLLRKKPMKDQVAAIEIIGEASVSTYDEEGRIRETTATPIYQEILTSWIEVEALSGAVNGG